MIEKLLAIVSLGQNIYGKLLFRRLLYGAMVGISLTIVTSAMMGAMLIAGFYSAYQLLLHSGIAQQNAAMIISATGVLVTGLLILITIRHLKRLNAMPRRMLQDKIPQLSQAGDVIEAFINGLLGTRLK